MSDSRSMRRRLSFAALALFSAALVGLATGNAIALEGVQGKYAIFYPSVDVVYEHTDNLFYSETDEVSANTWLVRPHLKLEIPNQRHYFMIEYAPSFRDNDEIDLVEDWSHVVDLRGRFRASPLLDITIEDTYTRGNYEVHAVDPNAELVYSFDPFNANNAALGFDFHGPKQSGQVKFGYKFHEWDRDVTTPGFLDEDTFYAGFEYGYRFRTLTSFLLGYDYEGTSEDFVYRPDGLEDMDSDANSVYVGFDGEFGRTTTGNVRLGYTNRDFDHDAYSDFSGLFVDGWVDKAFTRYTKLEVNVHRSDNLSNFDGNAYYTANRLALQLTNQPLGKKVFWSVRAGFQRNDYPDPAPTYGMISRQDDILRLDGEVGFHPITHLNLKVNYRHEERDSNVPDLSYTADHFLFQLSVGF